MKKMSFVAILFIGMSFMMLNSCGRNISYETLIQQGLDSESRVDSLFLGYHFGMTRQEFRDLSFQLNQQGLMSGLAEIEYNFNELKSRALMKFYPRFTDEMISKIPITVSYNSWAPWNEQFWPEVLIEDLREYYESVYDTQFHWVYVPPIERMAYVSVEGNREIRLYIESEATVNVEYIDLSVLNPFDA